MIFIIIISQTVMYFYDGCRVLCQIRVLCVEKPKVTGTLFEQKSLSAHGTTGHKMKMCPSELKCT